MICIIVYKIKNQKVKRHVERILLAYGNKIKSGVFECRINSKYYYELLRKLQYFTDEVKQGEFITLYTICAKCSKKVNEIGSSIRHNDPLFYIV